MSEFLDAWNPSLEEAEQIFGESFFDGVREYPAIEIESVTLEQSATAGGRFEGVTLSMIVRKSIVDAARIVIGKTLTVRGSKVRVMHTEADGDNSVTLLCGPAGVQMPTF